MLRPLYEAVWHRYTPIMSRLTFLSLKRPSGVSTVGFPEGISKSFSVRDHRIGGRGLPSTRQTNSAYPPSRTLTIWPPVGTDSIGGVTGGKEKAILEKLSEGKQYRKFIYLCILLLLTQVIMLWANKKKIDASFMQRFIPFRFLNYWIMMNYCKRKTMGREAMRLHEIFRRQTWLKHWMLHTEVNLE